MRRLLLPLALSFMALPALADDFDDSVRRLFEGDPARYRAVIQDFQAAIRTGDAAKAAALVSYPIGVTIDGKPRVIPDAAAFVANFKAIVTPAIAAAIENEPLSEMMLNYQGVMLGRGEVWVTGLCRDDACKQSDVKVITIQSGPDDTPASQPDTAAAGALRSFGDWAVGCDNFRHCTAIGMGPDESISGYVVIQRGGGAGDAAQVSLNVLASDAPQDPTLRVAFGGKTQFPATTLPVETQGGFLVAAVDPAMTPDLIHALATGSALNLTEVDGKIAADPQAVSLKGSSAALLYMDDQQKRVGTVTALVRPAEAAADPIPPLPQPAPPLLVKMTAMADPLPKLPAGITPPDDPSCTDDFPPIGFTLSATEALWGVCAIAGAYNIDYLMWIVGPDGARKADFTIPGVSVAPDEDAADLTNPALSPDGLGLNAIAKGRGLGDCGSEADWGWDGSRFVLLQYREMDACRGVDQSDWPVLYRVQPL